MKILVVYYSYTGNTKKIAEALTEKLEAKIDEIKDLKERSRKIVGWLIAGKDSLSRKPAEIKYKEKPEEYDLVIVGTPVWMWTMTPAVKKYLSDNKFRRVAFFCTHGGNAGKTFEDMEFLSEKPERNFALLDKNIKKGNFKDEVEMFCKNIKE
jgi:flavodoxin